MPIVAEVLRMVEPAGATFALKTGCGLDRCEAALESDGTGDFRMSDKLD